jgi:hypothetical protein
VEAVQESLLAMLDEAKTRSDDTAVAVEECSEKVRYDSRLSYCLVV